MTLLKQITNFYKSHRKLCMAALFIAVLAVVFALPHTAFAAGAATEAANTALKSFNDAFDAILKFASALFWPVLLLCGSLLDNDLIFGGAMGERLREVWVQMRNLVNIIFVLLLLVIAVYNVLGLGEKGGAHFALKTALPKFAIALIAVNFSFLAVKVVLDFTNVITGAVFALPNQFVQSETLTQQLQSNICATGGSSQTLAPRFCDGNGFKPAALAFFNKLDRTNIMLVYAVQFSKANRLKEVRQGVKDVTQLGLNLIFNAVIFVVYATSFIVLFVVLFARLVALWVIAVMSPFIALTIVLPNLKDTFSAGDTDFKTMFLQNAIAPIRIGLILSVGYIMLNGFKDDKTIHGEITSTPLTSLDPYSLPTSITDLQQLLLAFGTVVIIWSAAKKGADKTVAKGIVDKITGAVSGVGSWMAHLPLYMPLAPLGGQTISQMGAALKRPFVEIERKGRGDAYGTGGLESASDHREFASLLASNPAAITREPEAQIRHLREMADKSGDRRLVERLDALIRSNPKNWEGAIRAVYEINGPMARELKTKGDGWKNADAAIATIRAAGTSTGDAKASALQALADTSKTPAQLKRQAEFESLSNAQIEVLRKLPVNLREALIEIRDNKVALTDTVRFNRIAAIVNERNTNAMQAAITAARNAQIPDDQIRQAVQANGLFVPRTAGETAHPPAAGAPAVGAPAVGATPAPATPSATVPPPAVAPPATAPPAAAPPPPPAAGRP